MSGKAIATTWTVDDDGEEDFIWIQQAINAASAGDTIMVHEGFYRENVDVYKAINLVGNGSQDTIIDGGGSANVVRITSDYVNLSGFMITGSGPLDSPSNAGIRVESAYNKISDNYCTDSWHGIYIEESQNNTIVDNFCSYNNGGGINLYFSHNNTIRNNVCSNDSSYGIHLGYSDNNTIEHNTCTENGRGITLADSNNNMICSNNCSNNGEGIYLSSSYNNNVLIDNSIINNREFGIYLAYTGFTTLKDNRLIGNDIHIRGDSAENWNTYDIDTTNTVEGEPIRYYKDVQGLTVPTDAGQVILGNCTQMIVENQGGGNKSISILIGYSSNNIIRRNNCSNKYIGMFLYRSDNNMIANNTCSNNDRGIYLRYSDQNTLTNNTHSNNQHGIYVEYSNQNTITKNTCSNNNRGIHLRYSEDNKLTSNTCSDYDYGLYLYHSDTNTLTGNYLSNHTEHGLYLSYSKYITLDENRFIGNGIFIVGPLNYWNTHVIDPTNIVNEKPVRYYKNSISITVPSGAGQVILVACDQMVVENQGDDHTGIVILVGYSSRITIRNNNCSGGNYGIYLFHSDDNTVTNNICSKISYKAIELSYSTNNTLTRNVMTNHGISIDGSSPEDWNTHNIDTTNTVNGKPVRYYKNSTGITVPSGAGQVILGSCSEIVVENFGQDQVGVDILVGYSSNIIISNNICPKSDRVISLSNSYQCEISNNSIYSISLTDSDDNTITKNTCTNNTHGISLVDSDENILIKNTCSFNDGSGIYLFGSVNENLEGNILNNNTISYNNECGINLLYAENTNIYHNSIFENEVGIIEGFQSHDNIIQFNNIYKNEEYGIVKNNPTEETNADATQNWWGHASGPYHPVKNPDGKGDQITDHFSYIPWLEEKIIFPTTAYIDMITPNPSIVGRRIDFHGHSTGEADPVRFVWRSSIDGEFNNDTKTNCDNDSLSVGEHVIYYRVQDELGNWSEEVNVTIIITEIPVAEIESISPNPALNTDEIHFVANGMDDETIQIYAWRTVDYELYYGSIPDFFSEELVAGIHTIFLKVQDNHGFWSEEVEETLVVHERPIALIESISPNPTLLNDTISFIGNGSDDGTIQRYAWRMDDAELHNDTESEFSFSFIVSGIHTVFLKVQDNNGVWSREVNSTLIAHERPIASIISISPSSATEGETVTFMGNGTDDGSIVRYSWRTADIELYHGQDSEFSHSELSHGTYVIYLKIEDNWGIWSDEVSIDFVILPDSDGDGVADEDDAFPHNEDEWNDADDDGVGDNTDAFPSDPAASRDGDGDKYPDNWNEGKTESDSTTGLKLDLYPDDPKKWSMSDGKVDDDVLDLSPPHVAIGIIIVSLVGLIGSACLKENFRYTVLSIVVFPLYSKLKKNEVLYQSNRQNIYTYLMRNPGSHYSTIKKELNLGTSTLVHHLKILEREDYIRSRKEFRWKIFYPINSGGYNNNITIKHPLTSAQGQIINHIKGNGPSTMRNIERSLSIKQPTVSYNIRKLVERGELVSNGKKRNTLYSLADK